MTKELPPQVNRGLKYRQILNSDGALVNPNISPEFYVPNMDWQRILNDFRNRVGVIQSDLKINLPMEKRWVQFVNMNDLKPKSFEEAEALKDANMDYLINSRIGDCLQNGGGTFRMRVACTRVDSENEIHEIMSHEYGHTLDGFKQDHVVEEMKAYAFESLYTSYIQDFEEEDEQIYNLKRVHDIAQHWIDLMLSRGFSEVDILSVLARKTFKLTEKTKDVEKVIDNFIKQRNTGKNFVVQL